MYLYVNTEEHLLNCFSAKTAMEKSGIPISYGYTSSDEISLLLRQDCTVYSRNILKLTSVLTAAVSSQFSLQLKENGMFDCRIMAFENKKQVRQYFEYRQRDVYMNALNAHCYWALRNKGYSAKEATRQTNGLNRDKKIKLLGEKGINFSDVPLWQKYGVGVYWQNMRKTSYDFYHNSSVTVQRKVLKFDNNLPTGEEYKTFIDSL